MWFGSVKKGAVLDLAYAPDGKTLFTLNAGGQVSGGDLETREATALFRVEASASPRSAARAWRPRRTGATCLPPTTSRSPCGT